MPGYVDIQGSATNIATVTVNNQPTYRHDDYFRAELSADNSASALWFGVTNVAVLNNGTNADIVASTTGNVFMAQSPEVFSYDADGNVTNDGRWTFTWDAENRLASMVSLTNSPTESKRRLTFGYDYQGRRITKAVESWTGSSWTMTASNKFVYDGWNLLAELNATNNAVIRSYVWGLDLSGSLQGAGGVGGLLVVTDAVNGTHFVAHDGNGNVAALVKASDGTTSANYEYGPFGETLRGTGLMAAANPFRFSTKYHDDESDLVDYGYRYYSPTFQRWLNRDPLGEEGGLNLYGFVENDPVNATDALGLVSSLNFVPASELAWMLGGSAAFDASLSIGMQKVMAGPCDKLNWNQVGKDVGIGAALTVGTFGLSKAYELYQAGKLAKLLRGADELRELGRYDELTEMIALHGDDFGDAYNAYKRERSLVVAGQVASDERMVLNEARASGRVGTEGSALERARGLEPTVARGRAGLDANALANAIEGNGNALKVLGNRIPIVSPQAAKEYLRGSAVQRQVLGIAGARAQNSVLLRELLTARGGAIGPYANAEQVHRFLSQGARFRRGRISGDPQVLGSVESAGVRLITQDGRLLQRFPTLTEGF